MRVSDARTYALAALAALVGMAIGRRLGWMEGEEGWLARYAAQGRHALGGRHAKRREKGGGGADDGAARKERSRQRRARVSVSPCAVARGFGLPGAQQEQRAGAEAEAQGLSF